MGGESVLTRSFRGFAAVIGFSLVASAASADLHTVTFTNVTGVPTSHNPDSGGRLMPTAHNFVEAGVHMEAFWVPNAFDAWQASHWSTGFRPDAHFHHLENGYETSHGFSSHPTLPGRDLSGFYLEMEDGGTFDLVSLDYRLLSLPQGTNLWISTDFDPFNPSASDFTLFSVGQQSTFQTLLINGFTGLDHVFISADMGTNGVQRVLWDNIVLSTPVTASTAPIPGAVILACVGFGLTRFARRRK